MKHDARAEEGVLFQLKTRGPQTAAQVARRLSVTAMAVRQHLYRLKLEGLVEFTDERRKVGRPARVWRLTSGAAERFPDTHGDLTVEIIGALRAAFGEAGIDKLLRERTRRQIEEYRARLRPAGTSIAKRAQALAEIRRRIIVRSARPLRPARAYAAKNCRCSAPCLATRRGSSAPIISWRARGGVRIGSLPLRTEIFPLVRCAGPSIFSRRSFVLQSRRP
jgi:DNA-binding transcriptional ArsR family regulator